MLLAVFVPIAFLTGPVGRLFSELAVAVAASVLISGFIALTLTTGNVPVAAGGVGLLMIGLAARWQQLRAIVLARLPRPIAAQVPRTTLEDEGRRPTRRHLEFGRRRQESARQDALRG